MPSSPGFRFARTLLTRTQETLISEIAKLHDEIASKDEKISDLEQRILILEDEARLYRKVH